LRYQWLCGLSAGILFSIIIYFFAQDTLTALCSRQSEYDRLILNWQSTPGFLIYLFLCRCLPFCLLLILTIRSQKRFFFHLYCLYAGFIYGAESLLSASEYKLCGMLLCFFRITPQIFFYLPALFFVWHLADSPGHPLLTGNRRLWLFALLFWILGIAAEWGVNPYFIQFGIHLLL